MTEIPANTPKPRLKYIGITKSILLHSLVILLILLTFYLLIKAIYNTKYLSWMVGKW